MLRAGMAVIAFACLYGCSDIRPPKILEFETDKSQSQIIECLEKRSGIQSVTYIIVPRVGGVGSGVHVLDHEHMLILNDRPNEDGKLQVRSDGELTKTQSEALLQCI